MRHIADNYSCQSFLLAAFQITDQVVIFRFLHFVEFCSPSWHLFYDRFSSVFPCWRVLSWLSWAISMFFLLVSNRILWKEWVVFVVLRNFKVFHGIERWVSKRLKIIDSCHVFLFRSLLKMHQTWIKRVNWTQFLQKFLVFRLLLPNQILLVPLLDLSALDQFVLNLICCLSWMSHEVELILDFFWLDPKSITLPDVECLSRS